MLPVVVLMFPAKQRSQAGFAPVQHTLGTESASSMFHGHTGLRRNQGTAAIGGSRLFVRMEQLAGPRSEIHQHKLSLSPSLSPSSSLLGSLLSSFVVLESSSPPSTSQPESTGITISSLWHLLRCYGLCSPYPSPSLVTYHIDYFTYHFGYSTYHFLHTPT